MEKENLDLTPAAFSWAETPETQKNKQVMEWKQEKKARMDFLEAK